MTGVIVTDDGMDESYDRVRLGVLTAILRPSPASV